jgi:hypothetical protein
LSSPHGIQVDIKFVVGDDDNHIITPYLVRGADSKAIKYEYDPNQSFQEIKVKKIDI